MITEALEAPGLILGLSDLGTDIEMRLWTPAASTMMQNHLDAVIVILSSKIATQVLKLFQSFIKFSS